MANNGLHKLYGAVYTHAKPNLCPYCVHFEPLTEKDWGEKTGGLAADGICHATDKLLSCPTRARKCRCEHYEGVENREWLQFMDCDQFDTERYSWQASMEHDRYMEAWHKSAASKSLLRGIRSKAHDQRGKN